MLFIGPDLAGRKVLDPLDPDLQHCTLVKINSHSGILNYEDHENHVQGYEFIHRFFFFFNKKELLKA